MVKKIKKKSKIAKPKFNIKMIITGVGVILLIILLLYIVGKYGFSPK